MGQLITLLSVTSLAFLIAKFAVDILRGKYRS
jgi:hypothetical protein